MDELDDTRCGGGDLTKSMNMRHNVVAALPLLIGSDLELLRGEMLQDDQI
jgi:hypothetical protein